MRIKTLVIAVTLVVTSTATAVTQTPLAVGLEVGSTSAFDESILQLGLRAAPWRGGFSTVDFTFATYPDALADGVLLFLMDLGITHGVPSDSSPIFFLPHAGVSMVTAGRTSGAGSGAAVGYHLGAGLLLHLSSHFGIRADYTYRHFLNLETPWSSITTTLMYSQ